MNIQTGKTITDVPGFSAAGIASGIKKDGKKDLCVLFSELKSNSAAVFTNNKVKGAPVLVNMENVKNENTQAIVINSGNANTCTGETGVANARKMIEITAGCLKLKAEEVLVASTGALGKDLPMEIVLPGIEKACSMLAADSGNDAAEAILSTDTCTKTMAVEFELSGKKTMIAGMAKGSTMIHPNMGTLLVFLVTDANISKGMLQRALKRSVDYTYNMLSIDGDTSTNDMAIILSNGVSGNNLIQSEGEDYQEFLKALDIVNTELAKKIARDGDGCTKLIEVKVVNALTEQDAKLAARTVVSSNLVKCAVLGGAADWTRISCSLGYSGADFNENDYDIYIDSPESKLQLVQKSTCTSFNQDEAKRLLSSDYIRIEIDLKSGSESATAWGCDMSEKYVKANAYME